MVSARAGGGDRVGGATGDGRTPANHTGAQDLGLTQAPSTATSPSTPALEETTAGLGLSAQLAETRAAVGRERRGELAFAETQANAASREQGGDLALAETQAAAASRERSGDPAPLEETRDFSGASSVDVESTGLPSHELPGTSGDGDGDRDEGPPPARIDRFVVLRRLGRGGMGVVYAGYDDSLDRKVAIKLLRDRHRGGNERLLREAQALARLSHPNVVAVYEVGRALDSIYIAMEFVVGVTLGEWLAARRRSQAEIIAVFLQAGRGLAAAHAVGMIHRDFKPDNGKGSQVPENAA